MRQSGCYPARKLYSITQLKTKECIRQVNVAYLVSRVIRGCNVELITDPGCQIIFVMTCLAVVPITDDIKYNVDVTTEWL